MILLCGFFALAARNVSAAEERPPEVVSLQPGVKLTEVLKHPEIVTPTGIDVDAAGNIWVVASHTHFPPDNYDGPKLDEILVFNESGERSVFLNETYHTMDLELGPENWVYLIERSRLLRVRDNDGDGRADQTEDLVKLQTEAVYPHNGMAGLAWDQDGQLLFCLGENFSEPWTMTGADGTSLTGSSEGGVFRVQPDGSGLKRIARGMWNPFGLCVRANGDCFAVDNDPGELPPCRLLQIVEGGDYGYQRQYGSESHHPFVCWNGELRGTLPMTHPVGEAPCGVTDFANGVLAASWGEHHIAFYPLERAGAGHTTKQIPLVKGSRYFRPACIAVNKAEDREDVLSWYVTDWVDGRYNVHGYGRVWKLEIDLNEANWMDREHADTSNEVETLAAKLRADSSETSIETLIEATRQADPWLAQAAYTGLSHRVATMNWQDVADAADSQLAVLVALRMAHLRDNSPIDPDAWIPHFLEQTDPDVQFELLRWIADSRLKQYRSEVEQVFRQSDIGFELFEAAIATINTLDDQPEVGLRNEALLLERVQDGAAAPQLRAFALRMLPAPVKQAGEASQAGVTAKFPQGLSLSLLNELLATGDEGLSLEVVRTLGADLELGAGRLVELIRDEARSDNLRAAAVSMLSPLAGQYRELFFELAIAEDQAIREEALRGLRGLTLSDGEVQTLNTAATRFPVSIDLVTKLVDEKQTLEGRPADDDVASWAERLKSIDVEPDLAAGRRLFHHPKLAACSSCHRHEGRGNKVGPDLSSVHARDKEDWLLESILQPSREMSPEYRPTLILLEDGRTFTGIRLQAYTNEAIRDRNGVKRVFNRDEIELIKDLDISFMPNGIVQSLTDRELRDLIAFLGSPLD